MSICGARLYLWPKILAIFHVLNSDGFGIGIYHRVIFMMHEPYLEETNSGYQLTNT